MDSFEHTANNDIALAFPRRKNYVQLSQNTDAIIHPMTELWNIKYPVNVMNDHHSAKVVGSPQARYL